MYHALFQPIGGLPLSGWRQEGEGMESGVDGRQEEGTNRGEDGGETSQYEK